MAGNTILTIDMITAEAVRLFKNSNLFIMNMDTQYDPQFAIDGAKIGETLRIRLPSDYVPTRGPAMQLQPTTQKFTTLTVSDQVNIAVPFTSVERTMDIDNYSELVMAPIINNLAGEVAVTIMNGSEGGVSNFVSNVDGGGAIISPGVEQYLLGNATLTQNSADMNSRRIVLDPTSNARAVATMAGQFNPTPEISAQFRSGSMKSGLGYERWFEDQTVIKHTSGTYAGTSTINGAQNNVSALTVSALATTLKKGDFITVATVNQVNRVNKQDLGTLQQFVVTADVAINATSIPIYPDLVAPIAGVNQQFQTVSVPAPDGAAVLMLTKPGEVFRKSIAYTQKAVTMATADLVLVTGAVVECARAMYDGISMRVLTDYLPNSDQLATRVDVLFGYRYIRPEWLVVVADRV